MRDKPHIYTMPSGTGFLPSLAKGLREIYGEPLSQALILLPTRRAVRGLGNAFVEQGLLGAGQASLLPRMRPLADINPEEPPFEPGELAGLIKPSIDPMQRRFELARLVMQYYGAVSGQPLDVAGALSLADPLLAILDDAAMEEADLSAITALDEIQKSAAAHFQNAVKLYEIVQEFWPKRLAELDQMDPMARRVALLNALTDIWSETPPDYPVIVAGSTGTLSASARLIKCVAHMDKGLVVLPGLNTTVPDTAWESVGPQHPQNSLKKLIELIGVDRGDVLQWSHIFGPPPKGQDARRRVISEALVSAEATGDWPTRIKSIRAGWEQGSDPFQDALSGLSIVEAETTEEEALSIALMMRESLEVADKTATLITPDPALARRVKARLRRWDINVDYSQGEPLEETPLGGFLTAILDYAQQPDSQIRQAVLCKCPFSAAGLEFGQLAKDWVRFEHDLRMPAKNKIMPVFTHGEAVTVLLAPLTELEQASVETFALALTQTAEALAQTSSEAGAARLWIEDAGEKAASLLEGLIAHGQSLPDMELPDFAALMANLMRGRVVRPRFGMHPRLAILGPLEARMLQSDRIILGGLNEGIWPAAPAAEPFLSRNMRKALGLSLPERRFGLSAHDFAELAAHPEVILTRAKRADDGPAVASRWLWRLQTLMKGALNEADKHLRQSDYYLDWARAMDDVAPQDVTPALRPAPKPAKDKRWPGGRRQLSITKIQTWIRDPYSIYAQRILGLAPLGALDQALDARAYGNALHLGLETFVKTHRKALPKDAEQRLVEAFEKSMADTGYADFDIAKERTRLANIAGKAVSWMAARRAAGWTVIGAELRAKYHIEDIDFTLTGTADLIEKGPLGFAVTDYKTGAPSSVNVVKSGFDPQLPLTAFLLSQGAIDKAGSGETEELNYIRLKGAGESTFENPLTHGHKDAQPAMDYAAEAIASLRQLIDEFDKPETAYACQPRAQYTHDYSDYNHLARRDEWMRLGAEKPKGPKE